MIVNDRKLIGWAVLAVGIMLYPVLNLILDLDFKASIAILLVAALIMVFGILIQRSKPAQP